MKAITQINISENCIAILSASSLGLGSRWEVYYVVDGLEMFSHIANQSESIGIVAQILGAHTASHYAACPQIAANWGLV